MPTPIALAVLSACIIEPDDPENEPVVSTTWPTPDSDSGTTTSTGTDSGLPTTTPSTTAKILIPSQLLHVEGTDECGAPHLVAADEGRLLVGNHVFERSPAGAFEFTGCLGGPDGPCPYRSAVSGDRAGLTTWQGSFSLWDLASLDPLTPPIVEGQTLRMMDGRVVSEGPGIVVYDEQPDGSWSSSVIDPDEVFSDGYFKLSSATLRDGWFLLSRDHQPVRAFQEVDGAWLEWPTDYLQGIGALSPAVATDGVSVVIGQFFDPVGLGWDGMPTTVHSLPPEIPASGVELRRNSSSYDTLELAVRGSWVAQRREVDPHVDLWTVDEQGITEAWLAMAELGTSSFYFTGASFALTTTHLFVAGPVWSQHRTSVAVYRLDPPLVAADAVWAPPAAEPVVRCD